MFSSLFQALTPSSSNSRSRREYAKHISNTATVVVLGEEDHLHHLPAHLRYNSYKDHLEKIMMHAAQVDVQEFPAKEVNSMGKGTGFSEPLSSFSNTTLPHPDADTSKNATIVAEDIAPVRTHMRRSFLGRHHPKVTSGSLTAEECGMYDNIQYANSSTGLKSIKEITNDEVEKKNDNIHMDERASQDTLVNVITEERDEDDLKEEERKKGILRKLHLQKV